MNPKSHIFFILSFLLGIAAFGQNIEFIENKGQWDSQVLFQGQVNAGAFFVHSNGFTVVQHNADDWKQLHEITHERSLNGKPVPPGFNFNLRSHAYRVRFAGANAKARVIADKPLDSYNNYFIGNDPSKWASRCAIYQGITVKDLYPNIDLRYYTDNGTLKYDFIVNPGGNVSDITLQYEGTDRLEVRKGELVIGTSVGLLRESTPYTYQYNEKGKVEIGARYVVNGKEVHFKIDEYNQKSTLVIDPTLIFCTFSGSNADNWGFTATYGPDGSLFGGGIVFGQGFPVSTGAYQTSYGGGLSNCFAGGFDIGLQKISANGTTRLYSTYLGGNGNEMPQSLIVDGQNNLIVAGRTNSPHNLPGGYPTTGALTGPGGSWDITITKLNATGTAILGSRRIGGINDDGANITPCGGNGSFSLQQNYGDESRSEVNLDAAGNILLASCTQSTTGGANELFPTTAGAFQTTPGGLQDGVVLKYSADLSTLLFSTFHGGSANDATYVLSVNPSNGDIYVAGGTESNNLRGSTAGTIGTANHGGVDGYVSIISPNGAVIQKTTYLGTSGTDQVFGIQFDRFGFPYVMGQTTGTWTIQNAPWNQANGKQFISKLRPDLSAYVYSTAFGKGASFPDISPVAFLVDRCQNVYVSGWGGTIVQGYNNSGVQGLPVTPDAIKSSPDIGSTSGQGQDFYFFVLEKDAVAQLYGSFFGQNGGSTDHVDGGTSRFDQSGAIYQAICASCGNTLPFPTTPGSVSPTKPPGANCNLAMVKIGFEFAGVGSAVQSSIEGVPRDTAGCVPLTVDFRDTLLQAVSYEWNFGDGPQVFTTTTPNNTHTYTSVGTFRVMLVAIDSSTCNIRDTSYLTIKVGASRADVDFTPRKVGPCNQFQYEFTNLSTAPAGFPFSGQSFTWDFGDGTPRITTGAGVVNHTYVNPGTYNVKLILRDTTYCNSPDSVVKQIRVSSLVKADFETPPNGCAPYQAEFNNTSAGGNTFLWNFGDATTSTDISPTHLYNNPGTYTVTLTVVDSATCNITDTKSFTITVYANPTADFTAGPQPPIVNTPITFTNLSSADATRFKWIFGDGDSLITTSRADILHEYNATRTYQACLIASNPAGCADTLCRPVQVLVQPAVDVPNAFTPLSGDQNSVVLVRGYGFAKMKFTVWARWGEKVFETSDKRIGWDGRYKGKILPMDVYAYTLDVEFTDGTKARKTGDITLIR